MHFNLAQCRFSHIQSFKEASRTCSTQQLGWPVDRARPQRRRGLGLLDSGQSQKRTNVRPSPLRQGKVENELSPHPLSRHPSGEESCTTPKQDSRMSGYLPMQTVRRVLKCSRQHVARWWYHEVSPNITAATVLRWSLFSFDLEASDAAVHR